MIGCTVGFAENINSQSRQVMISHQHNPFKGLWLDKGNYTFHCKDGYSINNITFNFKHGDERNTRLKVLPTQRINSGRKHACLY